MNGADERDGAGREQGWPRVRRKKAPELHSSQNQHMGGLGKQGEGHKEVFEEDPVGSDSQ